MYISGEEKERKARIVESVKEEAGININKDSINNAIIYNDDNRT